MISNEQLALKQVSSPDGDLHGWIRFAHAVKSYNVVGRIEPCADLANSETSFTLTELGCSLFLEQAAIATAVACPPIWST